ncbi:haspin like kinase domain-containing protein [Phthorimaea operculella]|nr:haspin like kinase domain-containing protein [Phthorimaea operculella]
MGMMGTATTVLDHDGEFEDRDDTIAKLSKFLNGNDCDAKTLTPGFIGSFVDSVSHTTEDYNNVMENHETIRLAARNDVLMRCNQTETLPFEESYPEHLLKDCIKYGEGGYSEVFLWLPPKEEKPRIIKVMPIAGDVTYNDIPQKDFHEIIAEIVISLELSALRSPLSEIDRFLNEESDFQEIDHSSTDGATDVFNEILAVKCTQGHYPLRLIELWDYYNETIGSRNDDPASFPEDQQYIVMELGDAGRNLKSYKFNSAEESYAVLLQVAFALAVAEEAFQFEHRDLHWGNVVVDSTDQKYATFVLRGQKHRVLRRGVAATIIDYSLSRATMPLAPYKPGEQNERVVLYNDLAKDEDLFTAEEGDYQFEVYRLMKKMLENDWKTYEPYTNILWLHYVVDKMITSLKYENKDTETHRKFINKLKDIKERILGYNSAVNFVLTDNEFLI